MHNSDLSVGEFYSKLLWTIHFTYLLLLVHLLLLLLLLVLHLLQVHGHGRVHRALTCVYKHTEYTVSTRKKLEFFFYDHTRIPPPPRNRIKFTNLQE